MSRLPTVVGAAVAAVFAVASLGARGLLPPIAVLPVVALGVAAGWALARWPTGPAAARRRLVGQWFGAVALLATLLRVLEQVVTANGDATALADGIGHTVAVPLALLLVAQLGSAVTVRELAVVVVGSGVATVLAVGTIDKDIGPDLGSRLAGCVAVSWAAGLVTTWLLYRARQSAQATYHLSGRGRTRVVTPVALVLGSFLTALAAVTFLPHPDGITPHSRYGQTAFGTGFGGGTGAGSRGVESYVSPTMDLSARGELPSTPVVEVPAGSPPLWASTVMTRYDGRTWGPANPLGSAPFAGRDSMGDHDLRRFVAPGSPPGRAERADLVRPIDPTVLLPLLTPGQPVSVRINGAVAVAGGSMFIPTQLGSPYVMRSNEQLVDAVAPQDMALPPELPTRVRALAQRLTRTQATVEGKVAAVEDYLHREMRYRLDSPVPDDGEDAVDDFLFESKEGFCEHFAAAEAVLLRAVGVPTRLVTGFAGGTIEDGRRVMRGEDAHAWVQVHVGGKSWVWSDPTAGARLADSESGATDRLWSMLRDHWRLVLLLALAGTALAVAAWLVVRAVRARRAAARAAASPLPVRVLLAFAALEEALATTALARRPDSSVEEHHAMLRTSWPGGLPDADAVSAAVDVVQRVLYDNGTVSEAEARAAIAALTDLTARAGELVPRRRSRLPVP